MFDRYALFKEDPNMGLATLVLEDTVCFSRGLRVSKCILDFSHFEEPDNITACPGLGKEAVELCNIHDATERLKIIQALDDTCLKTLGDRIARFLNAHPFGEWGAKIANAMVTGQCNALRYLHRFNADRCIEVLKQCSDVWQERYPSKKN